MLLDPVSVATLGGGRALAGGVSGSAIGISTAASAGTAILSREPKQIRNVIILASIPMSQTFYGLIILILIITSVVPQLPATGGSGFTVLACSVIAALSFAFSGAWKGRVCASGISFLPKTKGRILTNSLMLAVFVELISVLGLVFTIMAFTMLGLM